MLARTQTALATISRWGAIVAGYALTALSIAICLEIVMRQLGGYSLQGIDEIGGYVLAGTSAFGFAYALARHTHTRIDLLYRNAPDTARAILHLLAAALTAAIAAFMTWRAFAATARSLEIGAIAASPMRTPLWIPQAVWTAGLALFACIAVVLTLRGLSLLANGARQVNQEFEGGGETNDGVPRR